MQVVRNSRRLAAARRGRLARRRREGNIAIMVVLLIGVIFGFASLAVDASQLYKVRTEGQNAADATALAAAALIDGTSGGITASREEAVEFADENKLYGRVAVVADTDVTFGRWSPATSVFTSLADSEVAQINAVRVQLTPADVHNPFAVVRGRGQTNVGAYAIAAAGGSAAACSFPLVASSCGAGFGGSGTCGGCMKMTDDCGDTAGWSDLNTAFDNNPGGSNGIGMLIRSMCSNLIPGCGNYNGGTATTCDVPCSTSTTVDESIPAYNGNGLNDSNGTYTANCASTLTNACEVIKDILLRENSTSQTNESAKTVAQTSGGANVVIDGFAALAGKYFTVTVPILQGGTGTCRGSAACNPKFAGGQPIAGYAKLDIYGVQCKNAGANTRAVIDQSYVEDPDNSPFINSTCDVPSGKHLRGRLHCELEQGPGGGGNVGASTAIPRLVE